MDTIYIEHTGFITEKEKKTIKEKTKEKNKTSASIPAFGSVHISLECATWQAF